MQLFAQLIYEGNIFLQTVPLPSEGPLWLLQFNFTMHVCYVLPQIHRQFNSNHRPENVRVLSLAIMRHSETQGTRLLGSVEFTRDQILSSIGDDSRMCFAHVWGLVTEYFD